MTSQLLDILGVGKLTKKCSLVCIYRYVSFWALICVFQFEDPDKHVGL